MLSTEGSYTSAVERPRHGYTKTLSMIPSLLSMQGMEDINSRSREFESFRDQISKKSLGPILCSALTSPIMIPFGLCKEIVSLEKAAVPYFGRSWFLMVKNWVQPRTLELISWFGLTSRGFGWKRSRVVNRLTRSTEPLSRSVGVMSGSRSLSIIPQ